jgi:TPR repeat protein
MAAIAAVLILGAIFIWWKLHPPPPPPPPPRPTFADLVIESEPSGANLTLDGSPPIKTPHTFKDLKFGPHKLRITLDGYSPVERDIEFSGASLPKVVLPPVEEIAKLSVRSDPPGATIRLDGTLPQEPNTFRNVKFGEHRLTATMEGFEPKEQLLVASKETSSEIILKLPPVRDPNQPLFDALKDAEAAYDWKTYQVVSLQLIDQLTSPGGPASNKNREKLTEVFEKLLTEGRKLNKERAARVSVKSLLLTSEEFRAHEKNLKSAARLDIVPAILIVADELRERKPTILGKVVQGDPEALNWYYYAAEKKNNTYAMTRIGWIYWWGECGQQVDKKQAFEWFKRASDAGDAEASTMVGESYLRGIGTPKDEDEGIRRLLPLTEKGWARAKNLIGQCYYNGVGQFGKLSQDERNRKAKSLYEGAILAGDWEACGHLGVMYEAGQGVPKDWRQAARLYLQGVEHENPICMYYYAQALENHGPELLKMLGREDDAETYYVKAAAAGVMEARQWCLEHKVKWSNPTPTPTPTATPLSP